MRIIRVWANFQTELLYHDHYLSEIMQSRKVETIFLTTTRVEDKWKPFLKKIKFKPGVYDYKGSKIIRLRSVGFFGKPLIVEFGKLIELLARENYDILHLFGIGNPICFLALLISLFNKKKIIIVANDHSNPEETKKSVIAKIYYQINVMLFFLLGSKIKKIIVPNLASAKLISERYNVSFKDKIKIIPLGYNDNIYNYNPLQRNKSRNLIIGFAGKIVEEKNIELLIAALNEFGNKEIECLIVGFPENDKSDYQKKLISLVRNSKINIKLLPFISDINKLSEFYNYIDVAVFPGSISITTIEANGCGTPVIIYESILGLNDRVEDGRGYIFKTKDELVNLLFDFSVKKISNKINHQSIAAKTLKYSWKEISNVYLDEYQRLISNQIVE